VCAVQSSKKDSIGVRLALGETQIVTEIRQFLLDNGVVLDSFSNVSLFATVMHLLNDDVIVASEQCTDGLWQCALSLNQYRVLDVCHSVQ